MHIPDGFVNVGTAVVTYAASAGVVGYSVRRTNQALQEREVPLMGVMAAFVFAAQMINFPVAGGTSGHLLGGALVAILLGPWAGSLIITAVLIVQALLFQDGGILALGANVFNMAVVGVWTGYLSYTFLRRVLRGASSMWIAGFIASWLSVFLASAFASLELGVSGTYPFGVVLPAMLSVHALIGIGEGLITTAVLALVNASRKDILSWHALAAGGLK
jgi:cobalt/nickel transport system permease protein